MPHPPILLFDFDGVVLTQKALEFAALFYKQKKFYNWKNIEQLRLIDFARLFEESDSSNRLKAIYQAFKAYKFHWESKACRSAGIIGCKDSCIESKRMFFCRRG